MVKYTDLGQGGETLLLNVPNELVSGELEALLHVQLGHVHPNEEPALRALRALSLHYATPSGNKGKYI